MVALPTSTTPVKATVTSTAAVATTSATSKMAVATTTVLVWHHSQNS